MIGDNVTYFDSFGVEYIPKEINKTKRHKNITANNYRIKTRSFIMYGFVLI